MPSPQTGLLEAEPLLREFMNVALVPRMKELGMASVRHDAMGNLIAEAGAGRTGRSLMLVTHAMNQPPSTMPDPYGGKIIDASKYGLPGEAVLGKGASEPQAPARQSRPRGRKGDRARHGVPLEPARRRGQRGHRRG